jgi:hypothetical protein
MFIVAVGEKPAAFMSLLIAGNQWTVRAVATIVVPHLPLHGCCGFGPAAAPSGANTNTLYQLSITGSASSVLYLSVQQGVTVDCASALAESVLSIVNADKLIVLDTLPAAHFMRDESCERDSFDAESGAARGILRVLDSDRARSDKLPVRYLASPNMVNSFGAALLTVAQMRNTWARLLVAVDRDTSDPCEPIIAFASVAHLIDLIQLQSNSKVTAVDPDAVDHHPIVRNWLAIRSKKSPPFM